MILENYDLTNTIDYCKSSYSLLKDKLPVISISLKDKWERSEDKDSNWRAEDLDRAIKRYQQFLYLAKKYPDMPLAPTKDIDTIWHLHILSPVAYYKDCINYLGTLLDHDGGFGQKDNELEQLKNIFYQTESIWKKEFNEEYVSNKNHALTNCWHDCVGRCWHACSSKSSVKSFH